MRIEFPITSSFRRTLHREPPVSPSMSRAPCRASDRLRRPVSIAESGTAPKDWRDLLDTICCPSAVCQHWRYAPKRTETRCRMVSSGPVLAILERPDTCRPSLWRVSLPSFNSAQSWCQSRACISRALAASDVIAGQLLTIRCHTIRRAPSKRNESERQRYPSCVGNETIIPLEKPSRSSRACVLIDVSADSTRTHTVVPLMWRWHRAQHEACLSSAPFHEC